MDTIILNNSPIYFNQTGFNAINEWIATNDPSSIFFLVDDHTIEYCYPNVISQIQTTATIEVIEIDHGEEHKNIETCTGIWSAMIELGIDRDSLMINLGGGVITDMGGFIASTIKRGIHFINIPTTLLGMVDAAIGGKNGIDLGHLKNQIGLVNYPVMTVIDLIFIQTLSDQHITNGLIEMYKHGLINDRVYWSDLIKNSRSINDDAFMSLIYHSVVIKSDIVSQDLHELHERKCLNFGHTAGHAIESFYLNHPTYDSILHGEAVAAGIIVESYISMVHTGLPKQQYHEIKSWYQSLGFDHSFTPKDIDQIIELMKFDKKNTNHNINFVLLTSIGNYSINHVVSRDVIIEAFNELLIS